MLGDDDMANAVRLEQFDIGAARASKQHIVTHPRLFAGEIDGDIHDAVADFMAMIGQVEDLHRRCAPLAPDGSVARMARRNWRTPCSQLDAAVQQRAQRRMRARRGPFAPQARLDLRNGRRGSGRDELDFVETPEVAGAFADGQQREIGQARARHAALELRPRPGAVVIDALPEILWSQACDIGQHAGEDLALAGADGVTPARPFEIRARAPVLADVKRADAFEIGLEHVFDQLPEPQDGTAKVEGRIEIRFDA